MKPVPADTDRQNVFGAVPFIKLLGVRREFSEGGRARVVLAERAELGNVVGTVHGGVLMALLDVAMASAAVSQRGFTCTAVSLNIDSSFLAPARGELTADGEVLDPGDDIAMCRATITDSRGRVVAQGLGSFRYIPYP